jgi:hypothetical protein
MLTAHTEEADIFSEAISELKNGLGAAFLKNSIGLIHCHPDFVHTDAVRAVCEAFPFPVAGVSCSCQATDGFTAQMGLTLIVLTSDNCSFELSVTDGDLTRYSMENEIPPAIKKLTEREMPKLIIPYFPFLKDTTADYFLTVFRSLDLDIPLFGTLPISDEPDFSDVYTIANGECYEKRAAFIGIYGDISPHFAVTSIPERTILKTEDIITESRRNIITSVSGKNIIEYLTEKGLCDKNSIEKMMYQPFIFHTTDGTTLVRNFLHADLEKNELAICGDAPLGSKLDVGLVSSDIVLSTAAELIGNVKKDIGSEAVLLYSCVSRYWALGLDWEAEINQISRILFGNKWSLAYSGGEIFPQWVDGKIINTLQNNCLIFCIL